MKTRTTCRLCLAPIEVVWSLEPTPLANELLSSREASLAQEKFPLDLAVCSKCGHAQLAQVVEPERLFTNYPYTSGASPVYVRHLNNYVDELVDRFSPKRVIEIASNDGTMLDFFMKRGVYAVGVEPAQNLARQANGDGLPTINAFFSKETAHDLASADLIVANHVLAHVDDLEDIVRGVDGLLTPDGTFVFEVGYLGDVLAGAHFDTIYHEHLSYHHLSPLISFFERFGMTLFGAERVDTQGGSVRCFVRRGSVVSSGRFVEPIESPSSVARKIGHMRARVDKLRHWLLPELRQLRASGAHIASYGAPAKAVTFLHQLGIGADILDFVVDDAPLKQEKFIPGKGIEILPPATLRERRPDVCLVLAWNFAESIMEKTADLRPEMRFVVPAP